MITKHRFLNGNAFRYGYSTGSCAAAVAKASVKALLFGELDDQVLINTPSGVELSISVFDYELKDDSVQCFVVKDSGDDPDVTNGIKVYARSIRNDENRLIIKAGEGIGVVTKKGLSVAVGQAAINPVPMQMIVSEVSRLLADKEGVTVEIFIPDGAEIAKRTFNERLGIVGGISILGTSGLVVPMSEEAFKEALSLDLSMMKERGVTKIVLTPGNYGERFLLDNFPSLGDNMVTVSNFIGYMLHETVRFDFKQAILIGHIGKLIKVAGGIFHTHSSVADARCEIFASHYLMFSGDVDGFRAIMNSNTTEEAVQYVLDKQFFNVLAQTIKSKCEQYVRQKLELDVVIFSLEHGLLGRTKGIEI